jgi:DNA-binding NarL/FixJ family response regulator
MNTNKLSTLTEVLTRQELKVLVLARQGMSNKEIAEQMNVASSTIKRHRQNIMQKLNLKGKTAMMRFLICLSA